MIRFINRQRRSQSHNVLSRLDARLLNGVCVNRGQGNGDILGILLSFLGSNHHLLDHGLLRLRTGAERAYKRCNNDKYGIALCVGECHFGCLCVWFYRSVFSACPC